MLCLVMLSTLTTFLFWWNKKFGRKGLSFLRKKMAMTIVQKSSKKTNEHIQTSMKRQLDVYADDSAAQNLNNEQLKLYYEFKLGRKPKASGARVVNFKM